MCTFRNIYTCVYLFTLVRIPRHTYKHTENGTHYQHNSYGERNAKKMEVSLANTDTNQRRLSQEPHEDSLDRNCKIDAR